ncbi:MAG: amino acid ABC transporter substrate-binding protein [Anaerolineae bacterium]|jgi:general L-amino acid transport system substrate-binding protein|nr:amino acid ABC transporter substrate-binding protein [Anaerolineae bacterium]MBT4457854.1 amino acid ABC transporter substrate-binding protein [Anaerolineae bacterium]MBT4843579.1 amino acid ABC transporter substrate-binding protein [Anaerolineae bacterium]MBT6320725.1 amino acid ABC transporter substrate-binding protein [Anaerolineae bacterium]MBT6811065.1 amino acid ABC transporter substrate-binding protein [Anaerolineae bacterium]
MSRKLFPVFALLIVLSLALAACGGAAAPAAEETVAEEPAEEVVAEEPAEEVAAEEPGETDGPAPAEGADTLAKVQDLGVLNCGVSGALLGFSFVEDDGSVSGFDADYCKVVAAAVLGDGEAVEFRASNASERFPILQSGEIDVLSRNTTWTVSRDTSLGFNFVPTTFYDGQGMIVRKDSGIETLEDMAGGTVCVNAGTTTEKNLADVFRSRGIDYEPVVFAESNDVRLAYDEGRCDGWTTDKSALISNGQLLAVPSDHVILAETMSKEPLGPLVRHGDDNWFDIVKWSVYCTFQAEELGIDSTNVDDMLGSDDPTVLNTLGVEGDLGQAMGLNNDFCYQIIKQVGNYEEIYNRALGPDTPYNVPRGSNSQWNDGGLLYSPPFR